MTDAELDVLELAVEVDDILTTGNYISTKTANTVREVIKTLISDVKQARKALRQAQKERAYLAEHRPVRYCPTLQKWETCDLPDFDGPHLPQQCVQCWLDAAREATSCLMY